MKSEIRFIDPSLLKRNPFNPNKVSPENMKKLEKSINDLGFVSAVVVRTLPSGELQILGGQHRVETAVKMGLSEVPIINVGAISDDKAKKIGLVDNARYGVDDTLQLAKILEDIGMDGESFSSFLPFTEQDFETISRSVDIDLDALGFDDDDEEEPVDVDKLRAPKPEKTHDFLRFRVSLGDAERIRQMIEKTIKVNGLHEDDELTAAGTALALLLLKPKE